MRRSLDLVLAEARKIAKLLPGAAALRDALVACDADRPLCDKCLAAVYDDASGYLFYETVGMYLCGSCAKQPAKERT